MLGKNGWFSNKTARLATKALSHPRSHFQPAKLKSGVYLLSNQILGYNWLQVFV
jgi:hypothetical protein